MLYKKFFKLMKACGTIVEDAKHTHNTCQKKQS